MQPDDARKLVKDWVTEIIRNGKVPDSQQWDAKTAAEQHAEYLTTLYRKLMDLMTDQQVY